jgi:hypothetical protein
MPVTLFGDESCIHVTSGHVYVIGLVGVHQSNLEEVETKVREAAGKRSRFHYVEATKSERKALVTLVSELSTSSQAFVTIATSGGDERSRRRILAQLFGNATNRPDGVTAVVLESRGLALDRSDKALIQNVTRFAAGGRPIVRHEGWRDQPMLWVADVVAGSVSRALASGELPPFPVTWM